MKWRGPFGGGAASGKAGSLVASRAKSTQYVRARVTPVNPATVFQRAVRSVVKALSTLWSKISENERISWNMYGANVTVTNALGDSSKLSGFNWFTGNNVVRQQAGFDVVRQGPSTYDLGNPDWPTIQPSVVVTDHATSGTLSLNAPIFPGGGTNSFLAIYQSRPYSAGKEFFKGPYQFCDIVQATGTGSIASGDHPINFAFAADGVSPGNDTSNNMQFVLRLSRGDGRLSSKFTIQA